MATPAISTLLRDRIAERMAKLGLSPTDLETRSGLTGPGLAPIRRGEIRKYQVRLKRSVCKALIWTPDSIDRILDGKEPQLAEPPAPDVAARLDALEVELRATRDALLRSVSDATRAHSEDIDSVFAGVEANGKVLKSLVTKVRQIQAALPKPPIPPPVRPSEHTRSEGRRGSRGGGAHTPADGVRRD